MEERRLVRDGLETVALDSGICVRVRIDKTTRDFAELIFLSRTMAEQQITCFDETLNICKLGNSTGRRVHSLLGNCTPRLFLNGLSPNEGASWKVP